MTHANTHAHARTQTLIRIIDYFAQKLLNDDRDRRTKMQLLIIY